jgi:glycosyltransferase involved in cell wall biosynthesis
MDRVILVHKDETKYMAEYLKSIDGSIFEYDGESEKLTEDKYYLCIRRVPFHILPESCTIGFVNTEQLCVPAKLEEWKTFAKDNVELFDYSLKNIELSGKGTYLPYKESEEETLFLKSCIVEDKKFNIAVVGSPTEYRSNIITNIRKAGFTVDYICEFGEERDKRVGQCSLLLNLHANEQYSIYESARCERWRFAGFPIITQPCSDTPPSGIDVSDDLIKSLTALFGTPTPPTYKIGLCMIVKNESHIIHEVLACTLDLIDTYVIVDTGSTDNTIEIIKKFYADKGMEGIVEERPWVAFDKNRSEALKLCDGRMDYILMIDADDLICFPSGAKELLKRNLQELLPNACNIQIKRGSLEYTRTQIFKANDDWRYVGVLHEYPTNDKPNNRMLKLPSEIYMIGRTIGGRSLEPGNKYAKDAAVLLKALETEPDNERYIFYLAQSYRDAGNIEEAIKWYQKRIDIGKWIEEVYISALNISRFTNTIESAWKAHSYKPDRIESLVSYATYCRANNKWSYELLAMMMYAVSVPKPSNTSLFIENDSYDWRVFDETAIISYYLGRKDISKAMCIKLLHDKKFPDDQLSRIEANLKFALG